VIPRKFIAATSREALHRVREALGDEAIILSNKQVPGGVEIIAVSEHEMDAFAHEAHVQPSAASSPSMNDGGRSSVSSPSSWGQEASSFRPQGGGRSSHDGMMGAASHYQHWEQVSWQAESDPLPFYSDERDRRQAAEPMSDLNHYWQSGASVRKTEVASAATMSPPLHGRSPVLDESVKTSLPPWMTRREPAAPVLSPAPSSRLSSITALGGGGRDSAISAETGLSSAFSTPASYPFMGDSEDLKMAGSAPLAASKLAASKNAASASSMGALKEDRVHLSAAVTDPNEIPVSYFHSLNKEKASKLGANQGVGVASDRVVSDKVVAQPYQEGLEGKRNHSSSVTASSESFFSTQTRFEREGGYASSSESTSRYAAPQPPAKAKESDVRQSSSAPYDDAAIQHELKLLRSMLEGQLAGFAWNELSQRSPLHLTLMRWMLGAGISPALSRDILGALRPTQNIMEAMEQVRHQLVRRLDCMPAGDDIIDKGGVYALVGTTGVGKTTTVAKLAARCTLKHGAQHVALLTTDSYRIGAHDQLKAYGRILSVPVYGIRDESDLMSALSDLSSRRLLLIDTIGMSQRDRRLVEQIALLGRQGAKVQQLLLIAANAQASTLEDVVRAYNTAPITGVIMSKMDEATQIGSVVDTLVRHRLRLCYYTDGQRVPEDLHLPDAKTLVDRVFQDAPIDSAFMLNEHEYPLAWK
jgi:flagellar biosynthesis protein FlhF